MKYTLKMLGKMARNETNKVADKYPPYIFDEPDYLRKKTTWEHIYDRRDKSIFGRTAKRWGVCFLFYLVFWSALAFMWVGMLYVCLVIYENNGEPWRLLDQSRLGSTPALVQYPRGEKIIMENDISEYVDSLNEVLSWYRKLKSDDYTDCAKSPSKPEDCYFDVNWLGNCTPGGSYGYDRNAPCIILRLNKLHSWVPEVYSHPQRLPKKMPKSLKTHILEEESQKRNMIWLSCIEQFKGEGHLKAFHYWPGHGFPEYFYPFKGKKKHISPIVAVQIESNQRGRGYGVKIECKAWSKDMVSSTQFMIKFR